MHQQLAVQEGCCRYAQTKVPCMLKLLAPLQPPSDEEEIDLDEAHIKLYKTYIERRIGRKDPPLEVWIRGELGAW